MDITRQVFAPVTLQNGYFITSEIWPDGMGFVNVRNPSGHIVRGSGFRGEDKAREYLIKFMEEWEQGEIK